MRLFLINASDGYSVFDNAEYDLPDQEAVRYLSKKKLFRLIHDDKSGRDPTRFKVDSRVKGGIEVFTARMEVVFD